MPTDILPYVEVPTDSKAKVLISRDRLLKHNDNYVIFITLNGEPLDNGARELQEDNLLPTYKDVTYERAKINTLRSKTLISLPLKLNHRTLIEPDNIKNCIKSLIDVLNELQLVYLN